MVVSTLSYELADPVLISARAVGAQPIQLLILPFELVNKLVAGEGKLW